MNEFQGQPEGMDDGQHRGNGQRENRGRPVNEFQGQPEGMDDGQHCDNGQRENRGPPVNEFQRQHEGMVDNNECHQPEGMDQPECQDSKCEDVLKYKQHMKQSNTTSMKSVPYLEQASPYADMDISHLLPETQKSIGFMTAMVK